MRASDALQFLLHFLSYVLSIAYIVYSLHTYYGAILTLAFYLRVGRNE
ncbi:hypothetical protein SAMN05216404_11466 [Nitrosospira multiformis]|uniref:Uncharacterized protein n=1 Tax=Nitrosospira multiformis TaxID=1231 RepID=A0A1H8MZW0_9PROT|nr:hypothetical protein SAMN05216404_11466 [Nitrosospira multiformis]